jgi:hypothetical protein
MIILFSSTAMEHPFWGYKENRVKTVNRFNKSEIIGVFC